MFTFHNLKTLHLRHTIFQYNVVDRRKNAQLTLESIPCTSTEEQLSTDRVGCGARIGGRRFLLFTEAAKTLCRRPISGHMLSHEDVSLRNPTMKHNQIVVHSACFTNSCAAPCTGSSGGASAFLNLDVRHDWLQSHVQSWLADQLPEQMIYTDASTNKRANSYGAT